MQTYMKKLDFTSLYKIKLFHFVYIQKSGYPLQAVAFASIAILSKAHYGAIRISSIWQAALATDVPGPYIAATPAL